MPLVCRTVAMDEEDFAACVAIRLEVFVDEQHVPSDEEMDDLDAVSVHVLAAQDGAPIGTGRLIPHDDGSARIGRMAVRAEHRRRGVGGAILLRLMEIAAERGIAKVSLAAQRHAIPFYERHGFIAHGDVFLDAGIEHRLMDRTLP